MKSVKCYTNFNKKIVLLNINNMSFDNQFHTLKVKEMEEKTQKFIRLKFHIHTKEYLEKLKDVIFKNIDCYGDKLKYYEPSKSRKEESKEQLYSLFKQHILNLDDLYYIDCRFENIEIKNNFLSLLTSNNIPFGEECNTSRHIPFRDDTLTSKIIKWNEPFKQVKYPIYVISKGRYNNTTARFLIKSNIDFKLVVEYDEYDLYKKNFDEKYLLKVSNYSKRGFGSIPVRNFCFRHSLENGYKAHWILDDNISGFELLYKSKKLRCYNPCIFTMIEDYYDLHKNIGMIGHNYSMFSIGCNNPEPLIKNCHLYSSMLINNNIYETCKTINKYDITTTKGKKMKLVEKGIWRGKYNEDVDLNLRCIKNGLNIVSTNTIVGGKPATLKVKGGNTDTIYKGDFSKNKTMSLVKQHPNYVKCEWHKKYGRYHHKVKWKQLQTDYPNTLELKDEYKDKDLSNMNNYNFELI